MDDQANATASEPVAAVIEAAPAEAAAAVEVQTAVQEVTTEVVDLQGDHAAEEPAPAADQALTEPVKPEQPEVVAAEPVAAVADVEHEATEKLAEPEPVRDPAEKVNELIRNGRMGARAFLAELEADMAEASRRGDHALHGKIARVALAAGEFTNVLDAYS